MAYIDHRVNRGEIYWIDQSEYRNAGINTMKAERPAVIVSSAEVNGKRSTYEVVFLTTHPRFDAPTHCTIRSSRETSTALCEQITTVSYEQVGKHLGTCTQEEMDTIDTCIMISLGLNAAWDPEEAEEHDDSAYELLGNEDSEEIDIAALMAELEQAKGREAIMRELYNELLAKTLKV